MIPLVTIAGRLWRASGEPKRIDRRGVLGRGLRAGQLPRCLYTRFSSARLDSKRNWAFLTLQIRQFFLNSFNCLSTNKTRVQDLNTEVALHSHKLTVYCRTCLGCIRQRNCQISTLAV
jgi:hypothetical protein